MQTGSIDANGAKIDYCSFGNGKGKLVILPGLGTRSILFSAMAVSQGYRLFHDDYTVWLIDRRAEMPGSFSVREMAADTAAAMDALGIESACVFGASLGGMVAQYLAIDHPERVDALVLGSTTARANPIITRVALNWAEQAESGTLAEHTAEMLNLLYSPSTLQKYGELLFHINDGLSWEELRRFAVQSRAITGFDVYSELEKIKCPVLVLGVEGDKVVSAVASREIAGKLGCECFIYGSEYGHCVFDEAPDYKQRLFEFFSGKGK